ncbi:tyrosine-protein phosphatase [Pedobacter sp. MC2016-24]|uniref:tyrosine-protein phosphatase n=1 Tax=Pedobacter sp. MC2016-24 TaxID=2780090 RepID=UPI0018828A0A|nr:CpsB/CapC family capsule biosynthesis tyrosine phosphatase [Pedobacter sp. MC2016-24]MBE9599514.1 histidinol phosphatase [Pedobacter sp. MC2016-24]
MFSFFKKKTHVDHVEWLGVDMHSHLLPGIDDGAVDVGTSVSLIKGLSELGFHKFICTPHIFTELYPNTPESIDGALSLTTAALKKEGVDIQIAAAAEYMIDETFKIDEALMCMPNKHILIEMSYLSESPQIEQVIFDLQIEGFTVILAHPERYNFYHKNEKRYHRFKDMKVLFQLNLLAVTGYYGKEVKMAAEYLLKKGFYDLSATDLHHDKHLEVLTDYTRSGLLHKSIGGYEFKNLELFK